MRICLLTDGYPPWECGGAQKIAAQLAWGYARRGHDVTAVTTVEDTTSVGRSIVDGVTVHRLWTPRLRSVLPYLTVYNPLVVGDVRRIVATVDPDVVHAHNVHYLSNGSLHAVSQLGVPVVKTFHDAGTISYGELTAHVEDGTPTDPVPIEAYEIDPIRQSREVGLRYNPIRNWSNRRTLERHVDIAVTVSDTLGRALTANGVPVDRTIHNGVDVSAFGAAALMESASAAQFRDAHGLGSGPIVLFGGRTGYNKGGWHLARAFSRVADTVGDVTLLVTGDDTYTPEMRRAAAPHEDRIVSTGWIPREDVRTALRMASVVATPSVHLDPFPTVNLEAFAAATPVVTSTFGGASELVTDGKDGRVVDPRDVSALETALAEFITQPAKADRFGTAGRRTVTSAFTVDEQVDAYLDILTRIGETDERPQQQQHESGSTSQ